MREDELRRAHIKGIIDKYLVEAGFDPYQGDMAKIIDAVSRAVEEILNEQTRSTAGRVRSRTRKGA
jgi:hypothetical protein